MASSRSRQTAVSSGSARGESRLPQISAGKPTWEFGAKQAQEQISKSQPCGLALSTSTVDKKSILGSMLTWLQQPSAVGCQSILLPSQRCIHPCTHKPQATERPWLSRRASHTRKKALCKICLFSTRLFSACFKLCCTFIQNSSLAAQW